MIHPEFDHVSLLPLLLTSIPSSLHLSGCCSLHTGPPPPSPPQNHGQIDTLWDHAIPLLSHLPCHLAPSYFLEKPKSLQAHKSLQGSSFMHPSHTDLCCFSNTPSLPPLQGLSFEAPRYLQGPSFTSFKSFLKSPLLSTLSKDHHN